MKRILLHDYAGHPFQVQLSRYLAASGNQVLHLYAGSNQTPHGNLAKHPSDLFNFNIRGVFIREKYQKKALIKRWKQELEYGSLLEKEIDAFRPDVMISANTPLDAQSIALNACKRRGIKFIFWMQDITGQATYLILRRKMPGLGHLVGKYYIELENRILRRCEHIISISQDFLPYLNIAGVSQDRISVIQNWMPLDEIIPCERLNPWAIANQFEDKFVFLYSGAMDMKHNPKVLMDLAEGLKQNSDVIVCVISEGIGASWLNQQQKNLQLKNLILLNYQPFEKISQVLCSGHVLLATLESDAGVISVPSKILSYACAGRPMLLSVPKENLAARIVEINKLGIVVPPGDTKAYVEAAKKLYIDSELRKIFSINSRKYAETNFDINQVGQQFLKIINQYP